MCQRGAVLEGPGDVFYTLPALCVIHVEVFETCSAHPVCVCVCVWLTFTCLPNNSERYEVCRVGGDEAS